MPDPENPDLLGLGDLGPSRHAQDASVIEQRDVDFEPVPMLKDPPMAMSLDGPQHVEGTSAAVPEPMEGVQTDDKPAPQDLVELETSDSGWVTHPATNQLTGRDHLSMGLYESRWASPVPSHNGSTAASSSQGGRASSGGQSKASSRRNRRFRTRRGPAEPVENAQPSGSDVLSQNLSQPRHASRASRPRRGRRAAARASQQGRSTRASSENSEPLLRLRRASPPSSVAQGAECAGDNTQLSQSQYTADLALLKDFEFPAAPAVSPTLPTFNQSFPAFTPMVPIYAHQGFGFTRMPMTTRESSSQNTTTGVAGTGNVQGHGQLQQQQQEREITNRRNSDLLNLDLGQSRWAR